MDTRTSHHALARMRQRGYRKTDLELVLRYGTRCKDGVLLDRKTADQAVLELKHEMAEVERLSGTLVILNGNTVKTLYRPTRKKRRIQSQLI